MQIVNIEAIRQRLARNEKERELLNDLLRRSEDLQQFDGVEQLVMDIATPVVPNKPKGTISYPEGLREVLRQAGGKPMKAAEMWEEMQKLGVKSDAKRPSSFISLHAQKQPEQIETMGGGTFRWIGD